MSSMENKKSHCARYLGKKEKAESKKMALFIMLILIRSLLGGNSH